MRLQIVATSPRTKILLAFAGQIILIAAYKLGIEWLFYPNLFWAAATLAYALTLRCPVCGRQQVFRGLSVFDIRLPSERCHFCGNTLHNRGRATDESKRTGKQS